jgi:hypothetical protein
MKDITFYTVMGGDDHFYDATKLAVESIHKKIPSSKIKVFDFGGKFENKYSETVDCRGQQSTSKKDIGYLYWREKYVKALEIDTEYAVYFDCDTVLINDFFEDIFDIIILTMINRFTINIAFYEFMMYFLQQLHYHLLLRL